MQTTSTLFQWPMLKAITQLTQANMMLLSPGSLPSGERANLADPGTAFAFPVQIAQGMAKNYAQFIAEISAEVMAVYAGGRGMLVSIAKEE